jgi:hypothetical protein
MKSRFRLRTKLLLCGATLAPASAVLFRIDSKAAVREAQAGGAISVWIDPGYPYYVMLCVGLTCFLGFVASLLFDLRRIK